MKMTTADYIEEIDAPCRKAASLLYSQVTFKILYKKNLAQS